MPPRTRGRVSALTRMWPPAETVLSQQVRDCINSWNQTAKPFTWTATANGTPAKVRLAQTNARKLVSNNSN